MGRPAIPNWEDVPENEASLRAEVIPFNGLRTTMSVTDMRHILGMNKTGAYWLLHKGYFETVIVNGKIRIKIQSFENWYANQVKYHKVDGTPPGEQLRARSYSAREISELIGICEATAYELIKREHLPTIVVDYWKRVPREAFWDWYNAQSVYRVQEDRERDAEIEAATITLPEMAKLLGISRNRIYWLLSSPKHKDFFEVVVVAGKKRVTRESFERWLGAQNTFTLHPVPDTLPEESEPQQPETVNPLYYTVPEITRLFGVSAKTVYRHVEDGTFPVIKAGKTLRIPKQVVHEWLASQKTK
jgi:excisionase family DNA binding protein